MEIPLLDFLRMTPLASRLTLARVKLKIRLSYTLATRSKEKDLLQVTNPKKKQNENHYLVKSNICSRQVSANIKGKRTGKKKEVKGSKTESSLHCYHLHSLFT